MNKYVWMAGWIGMAGMMTACSNLQAKVPGALPGALPSVKVSPSNPQVMTARTFPGQVPPKLPSSLPVPALIPPEGATAPASGVGNRPDPFSALPLNPTVIIRPGSPLPRVAPVLPSVIPSAAPSVVAAPSAAVVQQQAQQPAPVVTVAPAPAPVLPPVALPSPVAPPSIAQAIAVSGVVQAGSKISIIVQVPNESSTRYAVVGDYLANGRVLVKRIEMQGSEPLVVLEQDGAEFVKSVGSGSVGTL